MGHDQYHREEGEASALTAFFRGSISLSRQHCITLVRDDARIPCDRSLYQRKRRTAHALRTESQSSINSFSSSGSNSSNGSCSSCWDSSSSSSSANNASKPPRRTSDPTDLAKDLVTSSKQTRISPKESFDAANSELQQEQQQQDPIVSVVSSPSSGTRRRRQTIGAFPAACLNLPLCEQELAERLKNCRRRQRSKSMGSIACCTTSTMTLSMASLFPSRQSWPGPIPQCFMLPQDFIMRLEEDKTTQPQQQQQQPRVWSFDYSEKNGMDTSLPFPSSSWCSGVYYQNSDEPKTLSRFVLNVLAPTNETHIAKPRPMRGVQV